MFFVFPFYVVLAVAFGRDHILRSRCRHGTRSTWRPGVLTFTLSNLTHTDGLYHGAIIHTFLFVGLATFLCLLIGYPFAYFLARHAGRWRGVFLALFFAPFWISYMLRMLAWTSMLQDDGLINTVLLKLGIINAPYPWLADKPATLMIGLVYGYVPFMVLPLFATLDRIHPSILEAGRDLGASPSQTFWRVTFPASAQGILAGFVICALPMFGDYFTQQLIANTAGHADDRQRGGRVAGPADLRSPWRRVDPVPARAVDRADPVLPAEHPARRGPGGVLMSTFYEQVQRPKPKRRLRDSSRTRGVRRGSCG